MYLKAENEELTLPELVGQPTFSGSVIEEQPAFTHEQPLADQEMDTGLSLSSHPVSELLVSSQSPTIQSEEDQKRLFKERILEKTQELLIVLQNIVKREQRKQLLVEAQLQAEVKAVQKLLSAEFSLKQIPVQAPAIQFSREPDSELFVSGEVSTL